MSLLLVLFLFIVLFVTLTFIVNAKVSLYSIINEAAETIISMFWLGKFINSELKFVNSKPKLTVFLFNKTIYERQLQKKYIQENRQRVSKMELLRSLYFSDVSVKASYGFDNPYTTGIACGLLGVITQFVNIETFEQTPDFMSDDDYVYVSATANLNIGLTCINLIRAYTRSSTSQLSLETGRGG